MTRNAIRHQSREDPPITMPEYAHAFVTGGQTRAFLLWLLLTHFRLNNDPIPCEVAVTVAQFHFHCGRKQAQRIQRQGNGIFWDFLPREPFMQVRSRVEIHNFIWRRKLAPVVKKGVFAMPFAALSDLPLCRAYMSIPVLARDEEHPTARAYPAKCLGAHISTVTEYRKRLEVAGELIVQENYCYRYLGEGEDPNLQSGEFLDSKDPNRVMRRLADTLFFQYRRAFPSHKLEGGHSPLTPLTGATRRAPPCDFVETSMASKGGFSKFFVERVVSRVGLKPLSKQSQKDVPMAYFDPSQQRLVFHRGQVEFCRQKGAIRPLPERLDFDGWDDPAVLPQADPRAKAPPREWDKVIPVSTLDYIDRRAENYIGTMQREDAPIEEGALV